MIRVKWYNSIEYAALFLLLYLSCGYAINQISGTAVVGMQAGLGVILILCRFFAGKTVKLKSRDCVYVAAIVTLILMGEVLRGGSFKYVQIAVYGILIAFLFALSFSFSDFLEKLSNLIFFLCIFSLLLFFAYVAVPQLVEKLPSIKNSHGVKAFHAGFSIICDNKRGVRNQGIFWEPGAYQTFINLALIIELFYLKKGRKSRIFTYLLTLFTTFSTAGYIVAVVLLAIYFIQMLTNKEAQNKKNISMMLFLLMLASFLFWFLQKAETQIAGEVFGKLERYREGGANTGTVDVRMNSVFLPLRVLRQSPVWGLGYVGSMNLAHIYNGGMMTCTFVNWLSFYGSIAGFMIIRLYYLLARRLSDNKWIGILIFAAFFLISASENYARNVIFLMVGFMALSCNTENDSRGEKDSL